MANGTRTNTLKLAGFIEASNVRVIFFISRGLSLGDLALITWRNDILLSIHALSTPCREALNFYINWENLQWQEVTAHDTTPVARSMNEIPISDVIKLKILTCTF